MVEKTQATRRRVGLLVAGVAAAAAGLLAATAAQTADAVRDEPTHVVAFALFTLALQFFTVPAPAGGRIGVSAIGILATGFVLGVGPASAVAALCGVAQLLYSRGWWHRGVFDAAQFALGGGAATALYAAVVPAHPAAWLRVLAALAAAVAYVGVNNALLCTAIGASGGEHPFAVWKTRFRPARYHYATFGPIALAAALLADEVGIATLVVPALAAVVLHFEIARHVARFAAAQSRPGQRAAVI